MYTRLIFSAGLVFALGSTVVADSPQMRLADGPQTRKTGDVGDIAAGPALLGPRISVVPKQPVIDRPEGEPSSLIVKFVDTARMRAHADGSVGSIADAAPGGMDRLQQLVQQRGLTFEPLFEQTEAELATLERRAALGSARRQPDLAGIMRVVGPDRVLEEIANALNALNIVEFVHFDTKPVLLGGVGRAAPLAPSLAAAGAIAGGPPNIPNLYPEQDYTRLFNDLNGNGVFDVPAFTPFWLAPEFAGGIQMQFAADMGQRIIDEGRTDESWNPRKNGGLGHTIRVGVIEFNAAVDPRNSVGVHVDLVDVILEPGQRLVPEDIQGVNHGSATLGEIGGKDHGLPGPDLDLAGDNAEIGIIGMLPQAEIWFFPIVSESHPAGRTQSAIVSALLHFDRGDVLSFSIGSGPGPLFLDPIIAILLRIGSDMGITSVMAAGNSCLNLDDLDSWPAFDTGTTVVGAGQPILPARPDLAPFTRHGFSNHFTESARVDVQAWGGAIVTCGYGDRFMFGDNDPRFRYTATFGGTSGAAPMVAATCGALQGLAKMRFGIPLIPEQIRSVVGAGFIQEQVPPECVSGTEDGLECSEADFIQNCPGDPDFVDPDLIGNFPEWGIMWSSLNSGPWFDPSILVDAIVYHGDHLYGNVNALKAPEGNPLIVRSKFGSAGRGTGRDPFPGPVFMWPGDFTDIGAMAVVPNTNIRGGTVTVRLAVSSEGFPIAGFLAYNWRTNRWDFLGIDVDLDVFYHDERDLPNPTFDISLAHVQQNTGRIIVRVFVYELGFGAGNFIVAYDWINVSMGITGFGEGGGIGGP